MKRKSTRSLTKLRVVVDTNVFISGLIWGGNPEKVIEGWLEERFTLLISPFLLSEILLTLEKFEWTEGETNRLREIIEVNAVKIFAKRQTEVCRDSKDNQVLDLCRDGEANYLVTGDQDLLVLKEYEGVKIVSAKDFVGIIKEI